MVHCSPATVSRGGVIFVNAEDVGWKPYVDSWLDWLEVRARQRVPCVPFCSRWIVCLHLSYIAGCMGAREFLISFFNHGIGTFAFSKIFCVVSLALAVGYSARGNATANCLLWPHLSMKSEILFVLVLGHKVSSDPL